MQFINESVFVGQDPCPKGSERREEDPDICAFWDNFEFAPKILIGQFKG